MYSGELSSVFIGQFSKISQKIF